MTLGARMMPATGAISSMKLKLSLSYSVALIAFDVLTRSSVRRCLDDRLGRKIAGCARAIFNDKLVAEPLRPPLANQARADVVRAARGIADDDVHRPCRVIECRCDARQGGQRGSASCQMQEFSAGKFDG